MYTTRSRFIFIILVANGHNTPAQLLIPIAACWCHHPLQHRTKSFMFI